MQTTLDTTWWKSARFSGVMRYHRKSLGKAVGIVLLILTGAQVLSLLFPVFTGHACCGRLAPHRHDDHFPLRALRIAIHFKQASSAVIYRQHFGSGMNRYMRATPLLRAASATALATVSETRGSNGAGMT